MAPRSRRLEALLARFPADDVAQVLPLLLLSVPRAPGAAPMPPELLEVLGRFAADVGLTEGMDTAAVEARIAAHLAAHPPAPALLAGLKEFVQEEIVAESGAGGAAAALRDVVGAVASSRPVGGQPPKAGEVRAGPMARFTAPKAKR